MFLFRELAVIQIRIKSTLFQQFLMGENRYASLKLSFPEKADALYHKAANDAKERYEGYVKLAKE